MTSQTRQKSKGLVLHRPLSQREGFKGEQKGALWERDGLGFIRDSRSWEIVFEVTRGEGVCTPRDICRLSGDAVCDSLVWMMDPYHRPIVNSSSVPRMNKGWRKCGMEGIMCGTPGGAYFPIMTGAFATSSRLLHGYLPKRKNNFTQCVFLTIYLLPQFVVLISREIIRQRRCRRLATVYAGVDQLPDNLRSDTKE